ncbi:SDR family oxidoreductase [Sporosarcina pasteurii]|uniref:3-oxoacyl-[acyl-carrier-protein] reductase FabG n=1 Tax=Sporosarcina pasteurii TaxID=1474 RepID=A0A380BDA0_SPOPA|nr:SDR family oxidoreductase [Sporosarcina pasteurii]MDS9472537.1 SDR family oxidoreductase [Sporosarcina pasteurii]QBQ06090.1 SDR family oxidoreductase [Sporosarcina pasteurii]SUI99472.1 3-oxoacyl-[acyl-carrier-protein] reductase FabG [Sporosarcina pasteurii]
MDLGLTNKNVIVMASSKGLGRATALEFAKAGANVFLTSRSEASLDETADELKQLTGNEKIYYQPCDMSSADDIENLFQEVNQKLGSVDILINNTGGPKAGGFEAVTDEDWYESFEKNLLSYIRTTRAVIPHMKEKQFGRIINVSSSSTKEVIDHLILSNTFRSGMVGLTKSLARELAPYNILVNTVGPGRIETDRIIELDTITADKEGISMEEVIDKNNQHIPLGRYGKPEEFAKIVVFLASSANTYLTGQSLVVDGGMLKAL